MAKIIGYEKIYKKQYKAICKKCGAIILFDGEEISDSRQYNEYCFSSGTCPSCGSSVCFDKKEAEVNEILENGEYINSFNEQNLQTMEEYIISSFSGWPSYSNCFKNCKKCQNKCLYRKEPYSKD